MGDKQVPIKETDIKQYLTNHLLNHWPHIVDCVANSNNGSSLFIKTVPGKDEVNESIQGDLPPVTLVLLSHNHSVYLCYTDHTDGVYRKLQNKEDGKIFFAATDDNRILGEQVFGKDNGTKIFPSVKLNGEGNVDYLNINWLTGEPC